MNTTNHTPTSQFIPENSCR